MSSLFSTLDSSGIAKIIRSAKRFICYAGPGIQIKPAQAMSEVAGRLGIEMITVCLDFDERVVRMGFGDIEAVKCLRTAGIVVRNAPGLRTALVLVDDEGFIFTPTALYLEAEPKGQETPNAMRLSTEQLTDALARLSPVAKAIAVAQARTEEERSRIGSLPVEVGTEPVTKAQFTQVNERLRDAPPVKFDLARQVRVFEPYFQYVELSLSGAAIQRHRLRIPPSILKLGGSRDLEGRLRTSFDLLEKGNKLSSKPLEDELYDIRKNFTRILGKDHGRVVLKGQKPRLEQRLETLRKKLKVHQKELEDKLQEQLDESRKQIVNYYLPRVRENPPDAMLGQLVTDEPTEEDELGWLDLELGRVFPDTKSLIKNMQLDVRYKDVTYETLNQPGILGSLKDAFPTINWDRAYEEYRAVGEAESAG